MALPDNDPETLARLVAIAEDAGRIALAFFEPGAATSAGVEWKRDGTPVTEADYAVNAFLERQLKALWPDAAWLSEESVDDSARLAASRVIIVDPIDGTRGFARGDRHWAIAVALAVAGRPVIAIVHAPALRETYTARAGHGAFLNGARLTIAVGGLRPDMEITCPQGVAKALRDAGVDFVYQPKIASLALRIAKVASGLYQVGVASGQSHDWDLAAADLVLQEAGGLLADLDGESIVYNRPDPSHGVLVAAGRPLQPSLREALARTSYGRRAT